MHLNQDEYISFFLKQLDCAMEEGGAYRVIGGLHDKRLWGLTVQSASHQEDGVLLLTLSNGDDVRLRYGSSDSLGFSVYADKETSEVLHMLFSLEPDDHPAARMHGPITILHVCRE